MAALLEAHVALYHPPACNVTITELGFSAHPYSQPKDSMPNRVASNVSCRGCGSRRWTAISFARATSGAAMPPLHPETTLPRMYVSRC